jgi:hypothetical protein
MNTYPSATTKNPPKKLAASCTPNLPFCGLGDLHCLATRIATCSGMALIEQPLPTRSERLGTPVRS